MRKKEFMEKLCGLLAELEMVGQPHCSAFPCICGDNKAANDGAEVCEETAKKVFSAIGQLIDKQPTRCCLCNHEMTCVMESPDPMLSLYTCTNPKCPEEI